MPWYIVQGCIGKREGINPGIKQRCAADRVLHGAVSSISSVANISSVNRSQNCIWTLFLTELIGLLQTSAQEPTQLSACRPRPRNRKAKQTVHMYFHFTFKSSIRDRMNLRLLSLKWYPYQKLPRHAIKSAKSVCFHHI